MIMKTKIVILAIVMMAMASVQALPTRTITGKVTSAGDGSPLPGVNVALKGTTNGTVTNAEGKYSITVPDQNAKLVFSFIGYVSKEVPVGTKNVIDLKLTADVTALSEVVVTGHSTRGAAKSIAGGIAPSPVSNYYVAHDEQQPQYNTEEYDGVN
jgi:hypothetical protein